MRIGRTYRNRSILTINQLMGASIIRIDIYNMPDSKANGIYIPCHTESQTIEIQHAVFEWYKN